MMNLKTTLTVLMNIYCPSKNKVEKEEKNNNANNIYST